MALTGRLRMSVNGVRTAWNELPKLRCGNEGFGMSETTKTSYYIPWDISEANALDEARSYATPKYDLTKQEDRQRAWFSQLVDSYAGGTGLFCQCYDLD